MATQRIFFDAREKLAGNLKLEKWFIETQAQMKNIRFILLTECERKDENNLPTILHSQSL